MNTQVTAGPSVAEPAPVIEGDRPGGGLLRVARSPARSTRQAVRVVESGDQPDVEEWLAQLYDPEDVPDDELNAATLRWLRRFFEVAGPAPREVVWGALLGHLVELANDAVAAVLDDLQGTSALRPEVLVDDYDGNGVRIWINDGYTAPSMWALERPEAFVEVAEYFQEQLDLAEYLQELLEQAPGCWPRCAEHDVGLHAEVHDGAAVWRCRSGGHTVAPIGELCRSTSRSSSDPPAEDS